MTDNNDTSPTVETHKKSKARISPVWIIPAIAILLGISVLAKSFTNRGPLVEIEWEKGYGITAEKTLVKHKGIPVGVVEEVTFDEEMKNVIVKARLDPEMRPYLGETTTFAVFSAQIRGTNFQGLNTLLSGPYIQMAWSEKPTKSLRKFEGLDTPPMTPPDAKGSRIALHAPEAGSIGIGTPILFRNMNVGRVESREIADDLRSVEYKAFINEPYNRILNADTKFWNISGLKVRAGTRGVKVELASFNTLLSGGIAFSNIDNIFSQNGPSGDLRYTIFENHEAAVDSQYQEVAGEGYLLMSYFTTLEGLEEGAPLLWEGIRIGTVRKVVADVYNATSKYALYAIYEVQPERLGLGDMSAEEVREGFNEWISGGMRAQLASTNILTNKKVIKLVKTDGMDGKIFDEVHQPHPLVPSIPNEVSEIADNLGEITDKISKLPLDELIESAINLLNHTDNLVKQPSTQALPSDLSETLNSVTALARDLDQAVENLPMLITSLNDMADTGEAALAGISPNSELYVDLSLAIRDLRETARSLSALSRRLELEPNSIITGR